MLNIITSEKNEVYLDSKYGLPALSEYTKEENEDDPPTSDWIDEEEFLLDKESGEENIISEIRDKYITEFGYSPLSDNLKKGDSDYYYLTTTKTIGEGPGNRYYKRITLELPTNYDDEEVVKFVEGSGYYMILKETDETFTDPIYKNHNLIYNSSLKEYLKKIGWGLEYTSYVNENGNLQFCISQNSDPMISGNLSLGALTQELDDSGKLQDDINALQDKIDKIEVDIDTDSFYLENIQDRSSISFRDDAKITKDIIKSKDLLYTSYARVGDNIPGGSEIIVGVLYSITGKTILCKNEVTIITPYDSEEVLSIQNEYIDPESGNSMFIVEYLNGLIRLFVTSTKIIECIIDYCYINK